MKKAEARIYLDSKRPKKSGECSVKIRISFNRVRRYFSTGIYLTINDFDSITQGKRRTQEQKEKQIKLNYFLTKANKIIDHLSVFTFSSFEEQFLEQRNVQNSVSFAFDKYISELKQESRLGTAVSYERKKNSLESFQKNFTFAEVSLKFLTKYEKWMLDTGKSVTTIGIYLRSLRAIYNQQNIDVSVYPFCESKNKYSIPTSKNIKKALTLEEISKIYNYKAEPESTTEMARDYWMFLYLCNGMNVKDFCLLKWKNIDGEMLNYNRAKTERSKKESKLISVALKDETWDIIKKWGQPSISKEAYIFPHLRNKMDDLSKRKVYQQLTKTINKYVKRVAKEVGIDKNVTSYFARHSFATVLKRSGTGVELISELLGHSSVNITESYLDSFEKEHIQKETDVLTQGFNKAN